MAREPEGELLPEGMTQKFFNLGAAPLDIHTCIPDRGWSAVSHSGADQVTFKSLF
jgi:hypothetical protein